MVTSSVLVSVGTYCKQCVEPKNAGFPYNRPGRLILIWADCFLFSGCLNALKNVLFFFCGLRILYTVINFAVVMRRSRFY